jgi:uncharacterized protein YkuJ
MATVKLKYSDGQEITLTLNSMDTPPNNKRAIRVFGKNGKFTNHISYDKNNSKWKNSNDEDTNLNKNQFDGWIDEPSFTVGA